MAENGMKPSKISQWEALGFVGEVFAIIAVPTIACALAGRWLDTHFRVSPWFTILGLMVALAISGVLVVRRAKDTAEKMK